MRQPHAAICGVEVDANTEILLENFQRNNILITSAILGGHRY